MAAYIKKAVTNGGGRDMWKSIKVSDATEIKIKMDTIAEYVKMNAYVKKTYPDLTEGERTALLAQVVRHCHYAIDNYVDEVMYNAGPKVMDIIEKEL
jgi:hypothetical protein